jgi:hypothetical protein
MFFVKKEEKEEEEGNKSTRETRSSARAKWVLQNLHLYDLPSNSTTNSLPISSSSSSSLLLFTIYPPLQIAKPVNFLERGRERDNENGNGLALASGEQCTATYAFAW